MDRSQVSLERLPMPWQPHSTDMTSSYPLAPNVEDVEILRVVVRESLSGDLCRKLLVDIIQS